MGMIDRDENLIDSCVHLAGRTDQTLWITESMSTLEMLFVFQMSGVTKEHCLEIVSKFEPCPENQALGVLGIDGTSLFIAHHTLDQSTLTQVNG